MPNKFNLIRSISDMEPFYSRFESVNSQGKGIYEEYFWGVIRIAKYKPHTNNLKINATQQIKWKIEFDPNNFYIKTPDEPNTSTFDEFISSLK